MKRKLLLFLILFSLASSAQKLKKFSSEPDQYIIELQGFLKELDKDQGEALFLKFSPLFQSDLELAEQQLLVDISNNLLKKRVLAFESWNSLFSSILYVGEQEEAADRGIWLNHFASFSKSSNNRESSDYLRSCHLNFADSLISDERGVKWKAEGGSKEFRFENEPMFVYSDFNLLGFFKDDSTLIEETSAIVYPVSQKLVLNGGRVYFTRAGFGRDTVYAELRRVQLDLTKAGYTADSATLHSLIYLPGPTEGKLQEQLSSKTDERNATFPRFESYRNDILIEDIVPDVDYKGGFSMAGSKLFGSGSAIQPSQLSFSYEDKPLIKTLADRYRFQTKQITAEEVRAVVYLKEDSMFHPSLSLRLIVPIKELTLLRFSEGIAQTPFSNTYHNMDMYFDSFSWKQGAPSISMGNQGMGGGNAAFFESEQYFRTERFAAIQGLNEVNPLYYLRSMAQTYDSKDLTLDQTVSALRMTPQTAERFLMQMMVAGFVDYNRVTKTAKIKDKAFEYINDFEEKRDYDVIRFQSDVESGKNAVLSLLNLDLEILGIQMIAVSDSQKVSMFPKGKKITMQEGFNFKFDGAIAAGRFRFWGNEYYFNYDQFKVNMTSIDSMKFKVESFQPNPMGGRRDLVNVKNTLQNINGELFIDKSDNKSGNKIYHDYPIFVSGKESYVYYDRRDIYNKVYSRESFFVELVPFTIDSLDNTSTEGLKFDGTFVSAGIFPDMEQTIMVQKDYSLGFITETPSEGLEAYGGKGTFTSTLSLSNKGLKGNGKIEYLASTSLGRDFTFFPDSTKGIVDSYELLATTGPTEYPHVKAVGSKMRWLPKKDVMHQRNGLQEFEMYDAIGMRAKGTLSLSPKALRGRGRIDFLDAQMDSKDFTFKLRKFDADTSDFRLRASPTSDWAFSMMNSTALVDFDLQQGTFKLNDPARYFHFEINKYIAYMDRATWSIPEKKVEVRKEQEGANSLMVSVHRKQDSLQYYAGSAEFSLLSTVLDIFKVEEMDVADARLYPDSGHVIIDTAANMRILKNSKLVANRFSRFHDFYNCELKVVSRNKYFGSGILEYIDQDETPWPLNFNTIKVGREGLTEGVAKVEEEESFFMSPFFAFKGRVELTAAVKELTFDGSTLIQNTCSNIVTTWFPFRSPINPRKIVIDLPIFGEDKAAERLYNGIFIANDSTSAYSAFLSRESARADIELIRSDGLLYYDEDLFSYIIARKERLENENEKGNYLILNNRDCFTHGEGVLTFGEKTGMLKLGTYGLLEHNLNTDKLEGDIYLGIDFPFEEEVLKLIANDLLAGGGTSTVDIDRRAFRVALNELLSKKERADFDEEVSLYGSAEDVPKSMQNAFTFSDLKLVWDPITNSFLSDGDIGIGSILKIPMNIKVKGTVQLIRKRRGDEVYIYFTSAVGQKYYFEYKRNVLQFYSTDEALMTLIRDMDPKKKRVEGPNNSFINITIASKGKMNRFLNR